MFMMKKRSIRKQALEELDKTNKRYFKILDAFNDRTIDNVKTMSSEEMLLEVDMIRLAYLWVKDKLSYVKYDNSEIEFINTRNEELKRMRLYLRDEIDKEES